MSAQAASQKATCFHISSSIFRAIIMKNPGFIIDPSSARLPVRPATGNRYMQNILMPTDWEATLRYTRERRFIRETGFQRPGSILLNSFHLATCA